VENELDPYKWLDKSRMEFLADGLFAIVITLLVLEIKVPVGESISSSADLLVLLKTQLPKFASYIMSFVVLMMVWSNYTVQYKYIDKVDRGLFLISVYLLFNISLVPFTTAFLSEHIHFKLSIVLYWFNLMLMGSSLGIHWHYVYKNELLKRPAAELADVNHVFVLRGKTALPLYTLCALLCFVSNYLSIALIFIVQISFALGIDQRIRIRWSKGRK
jgi:uncharacterized membrane protein